MSLIRRLAVAGVVCVLTFLTFLPGAEQRLGAAPSPCSFDGIPRIVAIGDVHGAYDRFVEILKVAGLIDGQLRWIGGAAHLVQTGDVVDRGADSRSALDLLRKLQKDAPRAGGAVHPLLGNHEVARMLGDMRYAVPGEYKAFVSDRSEEIRQNYVRQAATAARDQLLRDTQLGYIELRVAFGRDGEYGKWLRTLDATVRINGIVFLHGGISPATAAMSCDEINSTVRREIGPDMDKTRTAPLTSLAAREDGPLWYRGLMQMTEEDADAILAKQEARGIVVGHTVTQTARITMHFGGKVIAIDTGMQPEYVKGGRASALEFRGDTITAIYVDKTETLRAGRISN